MTSNILVAIDKHNPGWGCGVFKGGAWAPNSLNCLMQFSRIGRKDGENYRGLTALVVWIAVCMLAAPPTPVGSRYTVIYKDTVLNCAGEQIKIRDARLSAGNMLYIFTILKCATIVYKNYDAGDSNMDTPISLADLCYLHIISHLEHYPLHHLAKLSYPVRRKLLQNLPACDIVELENTCVADGIGDLESEVWQQYCARQQLYVESGLGPRKSFFEAILSRLFSLYDDHLRRWLFSVPKCLSIANLTSFTSVAYKDLDRLVPHRYAALCDPNIKSRCDIHGMGGLSFS